MDEVDLSEAVGFKVSIERYQGHELGYDWEYAYRVELLEGEGERPDVFEFMEWYQRHEPQEHPTPEEAAAAFLDSWQYYWALESREH